MSDAEKARKEDSDKQKRINDQWAAFKNVHGRDAYEDLMSYIEGQREMFRLYAEERQMPHPNPNEGRIPIDNELVAALLQNSRGLNIVRTYITNRANADDVAPVKK